MVCAPGTVRIPRIRERVVCGLSLVIATLAPSRRFRSVDFPTFERPTRATVPQRDPAFTPEEASVRGAGLMGGSALMRRKSARLAVVATAFSGLFLSATPPSPHNVLRRAGAAGGAVF